MSKVPSVSVRGGEEKTYFPTAGTALGANMETASTGMTVQVALRRRQSFSRRRSSVWPMEMSPLASRKTAFRALTRGSLPVRAEISETVRRLTGTPRSRKSRTLPWPLRFHAAGLDAIEELLAVAERVS